MMNVKDKMNLLSESFEFETRVLRMNVNIDFNSILLPSEANELNVSHQNE